MRDTTKIKRAHALYVQKEMEFRAELEKQFPRGAWFEVCPFRNQKKPVRMQVVRGCWYGSCAVVFQMPKRGGRGYVRRTVAVDEIGRMIDPVKGDE